MASILDGRAELKAVIDQIAEVTGYLWQKGWAERNGGNITVNVTEYMDDACKAMKPISETKQIGMVLPQLKGKYFYCKGTGKRMRDLAKFPMQNGSIIRICDDCASYEVIADEPVVSRVTIVQGGETRTDSVRNGLNVLSDLPNHSDYVAIHDGARPFVPVDVVQNVLAAAAECGIAAPGLPLTDTVKRISADGIVAEHLRRTELTAIQTPQIFWYDILAELYKHNCATFVTDDTELASLTGHSVKIVSGSRDLNKLTYPEDLLWAERIAQRYLSNS